MQKARIVVRDTNGRPVQGATVTIYDGGTSNTSTIYSDDGVTAISGAAITTDAYGVAEFYAADVGTPGYDATVTGTGITTNTVDDIRLHDPYDTNVTSGKATENIIAVTDGVTAPTQVSGVAQFYVDTADGLPKVIDGDGNVYTLYSSSVTGLPWHHAVNDHSADNTGASDTTTEMQACIDAAEASGSTVAYFPAGTYLYTQLSVGSDVTLMGDGPGRTIFATTQTLATAGADNYATTSSIVSDNAGHASNMSVRGGIKDIGFQRDSTVDTADNVAFINVCNFKRFTFENLDFTGGETGLTYGFVAGDGGDGSFGRTPFIKNVFRDCYMVGSDANNGDAIFKDQVETGTQTCYGNRLEGLYTEDVFNPIIIQTGMEGTLTFNCAVSQYRTAIADNGEGSIIFANCTREDDNNTTTMGVDIAGYAQRVIGNYYDSVEEAKWASTTGAQVQGILIDGGSDEAEASKTMLNELRFTGSVGPARNGVYNALTMETDGQRIYYWFDQASLSYPLIAVGFTGAYGAGTAPTDTTDYIGQLALNTSDNGVWIAFAASQSGASGWKLITP